MRHTDHGNPCTAWAAYQMARAVLTEQTGAGDDTAAWLMCEVCNLDLTTWLLTRHERTLTEQETERFNNAIERLRQHEPLAYVLGHTTFMGHRMEVNAATLIPRPETETMVAWLLDQLEDKEADWVCCDLGTGSGAIAIALANALPNARVLATDQSSEALDVARRNAVHHGVDERISWHQGDWWWALPSDASFDLVVCNPPYLAANDPHLSNLSLRHEPLNALVGGPDGLKDLRQITASLGWFLQPGGWFAVEHGHDQADAVLHHLQTLGFHGTSHLDTAGVQRFVTVQRPATPALASPALTLNVLWTRWWLAWTSLAIAPWLPHPASQGAVWGALVGATAWSLHVLLAGTGSPPNVWLRRFYRGYFVKMMVWTAGTWLAWHHGPNELSYPAAFLVAALWTQLPWGLGSTPRPGEAVAIDTLPHPEPHPD